MQRALANIEAGMNTALADVKTHFEGQAKPFHDTIEELTEGLKMWAEANRSALTGDGKTKTVDLGTGKVLWRLRPPSVRIAKAVADTLVETLKALGLSRFIRTKEEVNRDAMQAEPDVAGKVSGITIGSAGEDFVVEPFGAELADPVKA
jgi:phage host-nuclease inhibitor protein Gam